MDRVAFITTESGDDLIVSFAVQCLEDAPAIESLILIRTPKYESLVDEDERGVSVSFERYDEREDDYLEAIEYLDAEKIVRVRTSLNQYDLDVRRVGAKELKQMRQVLRKMNYDHKFKASGV